MNIEEIKKSGMLELYLLDQLSPQEHAMVAKALDESPELRQELLSIEHAYEAFAQSNAVQPTKSYEELFHRDSDLPKGKREEPVKTGGKITSILSTVLFSLLAATLWFAWSQSKDAQQAQKQYQELQYLCDSIQEDSKSRLKVIDDLEAPETILFAFSATPSFPQTSLTLFNNPAVEKNYIKINQLPVIEANQTFQLWSLQEGSDPIPLNTFTGKNGEIIPVDFASGTKTYAITIEKSGGAQTPNLQQLIATSSV